MHTAHWFFHLLAIRLMTHMHMLYTNINIFIPTFIYIYIRIRIFIYLSIFDLRSLCHDHIIKWRMVRRSFYAPERLHILSDCSEIFSDLILFLLSPFSIMNDFPSGLCQYWIYIYPVIQIQKKLGKDENLFSQDRGKLNANRSDIVASLWLEKSFVTNILHILQILYDKSGRIVWWNRNIS